MSDSIINFNTPVQVIFGEGRSQEVGEVLKKRNHKKILLVTDKGLEATGIPEKIRSVIKEQGIEVVTYDKIKANPTEENVHEGRDLILEYRLDGVLAVGGGSPIDASKAMSMLSVHGGDIVDYEYGLKPVVKRGPDIYIIPTTSGTGSEVTFWSVITNQKTKRKTDIGSPYMASSVSFVDPELTYGLPPSITAATGIDALCHAVEAFTTKGSNTLTDTLALKAIELVGKNLYKAFEDGNNKEARRNMMLASTMAGFAFPNVGLGAVHGLAMPVGGHFDVPHGDANAILLPYVMDFNKPAVEQKYIEIAKAFGIENGTADDAIQFISDLAKKMDIPSLQSFGIKESDLDILAKDALGKNSNCDSNPREMKYEDAYEVLKNALKEK